jgi:hypothetical protein
MLLTNPGVKIVTLYIHLISTVEEWVMNLIRGLVSITTDLWSWLTEMTFYSTIIVSFVSLDIAVLSFAIPLGFNIISKILKEYGDEVSQIYTTRLEIKFIVPLVISHLFLSLWFIAIESPNNPITRYAFFIALIIYTIFVIAISYWVARYTFKIAFRPRFVKSIFIDKINNSLQGRKASKFYSNIDGFGNLLNSFILQKEHSLVIAGAQDLEVKFEEVLKLILDEPDQEHFLFTDDYIDYMRDPKNKEQPYFTTGHVRVNAIIQILQNLFESAHGSGYKNVSIEMYKTLIRLLHKAAMNPQLGLVVGKALATVQKVATNAMEEQDLPQYLSFYWYTSAVFPLNKMNRIDNKFFAEFNSTLFRILLYSIKNGYDKVFQAFTEMSHDGIHYQRMRDPRNTLSESFCSDQYKESTLSTELCSDYSRLLRSIESKVTSGKLKGFISSVENLKSKHFKDLESDFRTKYKQDVAKLTRSVEDRYMWDEFRTMVSYVLAFCILKSQENKIVSFWQYKQPANASATWSGNDIFDPHWHKYLIFHYSDKDDSDLTYDFHEGHIGTEIYLDYLLGLRLVYEFRIVGPVPHELQTPSESIDVLFGLERSFSTINEYLSILKKKENIYASGEYSRNQIIFPEFKLSILAAERYLITVKENLEGLKDKYIETQSISEQKLSKFGLEIFGSYSNSRKAYPAIQMVSNLPLSNDVSEPKKISSGTIEKAQFIDWRVSFIGWAEMFGTKIANNEDLSVDKYLSSQAKTQITATTTNLLSQLHELLARYESLDLIISTTYMGYLSTHAEEDHDDPIIIDRLENNHFRWVVNFQDRNIPILYLQNATNDHLLLISTRNDIEKLNPDNRRLTLTATSDKKEYQINAGILVEPIDKPSEIDPTKVNFIAESDCAIKLHEDHNIIKIELTEE